MSGTLSSVDRRNFTATVQRLFYEAHFPADLLANIVHQVKSIMPDASKIKFRSSANAEDIEGFDGAGLYDSFSAKVKEKDNADGKCKRVVVDSSGVKDKLSPRSIQCAIKGVYASLWNTRAVEERSFARIDHASCAMAMACLPGYDDDGDEIISNAVIVTRVDQNVDLPGYTLSVQEGDNLVTNPDPGSLAETDIISLYEDAPMSISTIHFAKPSATEPVRNTTILDMDTTKHVVEVSAWIEQAYCNARPNYSIYDCHYIQYIPAKTQSLDIDIKMYEKW